MTTRQGTVSTLQWLIIEFILRLTRQLWSQYVKWLGQSVGLVEHELISIVATATRLLALHALDPEIGWWNQFTMSMWLDVLLYESVIFRAVSNRAKRKAFLAAIKAQHSLHGELSVSFVRAQSTFKMWLF